MLRERAQHSISFLFYLNYCLVFQPPSTSLVMLLVAMTGKENPQKTKFGNRQLPVQLLKLGFQEDGANLHFFFSPSLCPPSHLSLDSRCEYSCEVIQCSRGGLLVKPQTSNQKIKNSIRLPQRKQQQQSKMCGNIAGRMGGAGNTCSQNSYM